MEEEINLEKEPQRNILKRGVEGKESMNTRKEQDKTDRERIIVEPERFQNMQQDVSKE